MKKTYYFPHDYHARHDPKLERLRMEVGPVSDGIYWDLVEMLYEENGYLFIKDIPIYAKMLNTSEELISKVTNSTLFVIENGKFYSQTLVSRLEHINKVRNDRKYAGKIGGEANAIANRKHLRSNIKESKVKESKVKKIVTPPPVDFLTSLKQNPAYRHINIDNELLKMDAWLLTHKGRKKTPRFVVNWMNKIEAPLKTEVSKRYIPPAPKPTGPVATDAEVKEHLNKMRSLTSGIGGV